MSIDPRILTLSASFEMVEISLPTGQSVLCVKQRSTLIPLGKVLIYGLGKIMMSDKEVGELARLKQERRADQRTFRASNKEARLHELQRRVDNQRKSHENYRALQEVGFSDSANDIQWLIAHLLEVGDSVSTSTSGGEMIRSQLSAPNGVLTVQSGWRLVEDDQRYLTTVHFVSSKPT